MRLSRCLSALAAFSLMLGTFSSAEEGLGRVTSVSHAREEGRLALSFQTDEKPEVSAYFLSGPDRLVVEFNKALPQAVLPARPRDSMVRSWKLQKRGLNRTRMIMSLNYRPASSDLKVVERDEPPGVDISFPTGPGVQQKLALTEGITWIREDKFLGGRWTRLNRLLFDPKDPHIEVAIGLAKEKTNAREKLSSMVARYDAVAGINGGFFAGRGGALGLVFRQGRMLAPHVSRRPPRSGFGLTRSGEVLFGRLAAQGQRIQDLDGGDWSQAWLALGGGPRLVKAGLAKITADLEELGPKGNDITRVAARTVVGLTNRGELLFGTVTGYRDNHSQGVQFGPLVGWLKGLGVKEAVNFDGGASVDMVIGSHIVSDGPGNRTKEKPVATALLVKDDRAELYPNSVKWSLSSKRMPADGKTEQEAVVRLYTPAGALVPDGTPVSFFGANLVVEPAQTSTQNGEARVQLRSTLRPGRARLSISAGPFSEEKSLTLSAGEPGRIYLKLADVEAAEEEGVQLATIKIQVVDEWGNGLPRESFSCSVDGSEEVEFSTDRRGLSAVDLELSTAGGLFRVSHPELGSRELKIEALPVTSE